MTELAGVGDLTGDKVPDVPSPWRSPPASSGCTPARRTASARECSGTSWTKVANLSAVGDLSRDGKPDFVALDTSTGKLYLQGPTFTGSSRVQIGTGWNGMRSLTGVGDMTADGIPDLIAVTSTAGDMYLYPGKPSALGTRTKQGTGWNG